MAGAQNTAVEAHERHIYWGKDTDTGIFDRTSLRTHTAEATVTLAQLNAGHTILAGVAGRRYRVVDFIIRFNGTFLTSTDIRLSSTEGTPSDIVTILIANATTGAVHRAGVGTNTLTAANFGTSSLVAGTGIQLRQTGPAATGGTDVMVVVFYRITA